MPGCCDPMTALTKYQKLESVGLWRSTPTAQRREVVVNLGDTSLVLTDTRTGSALAHWSLPALTRHNPGEMPALYSPDPDGADTLELDDAEMIAALEKVHSVLDAARPHPGRLRNTILIAVAAGLLLIAVVWLPGALVRHTASVIPDTTRAEIGKVALADLTRLTGPPCVGRRGQQALTRLSLRIFGASPARRMTVVRKGIVAAVHLPGHKVIVSEALLADHDNPDIVAGYALAQGIAADRTDPMVPLLRHAGIAATFRLLTTGTLPPEAVAGYAETLIASQSPPAPVAVLLSVFGAAGVPVTPYAQTRFPGTAEAAMLSESDPFADAAPPPLLPDEDWIALQDICAR